MNDDEFYYTLQSNASKDLFPLNTCNHFKVHLKERKILPGKWVVGISEFHFPLDFSRNVNACYEKSREGKRKLEYEVLNLDVEPEPKKLKKVDVNADIEKSIAEEEDRTRRLRLRILSMTETLKIDPASNVAGVINTLATDVQRTELYNLKLEAELQKVKSEFEKYLSRGITINTPKTFGPSYLYVYCDIVEYELVGDKFGPFLRVARVPPNPEKETGEKDWSKPHYKKVSRREFDTLEVDIRDEHGCIVSFAKGIVIVTLHFKKVA